MVVADGVVVDAERAAGIEDAAAVVHGRVRIKRGVYQSRVYGRVVYPTTVIARAVAKKSALRRSNEPLL